MPASYKAQRAQDVEIQTMALAVTKMRVWLLLRVQRRVVVHVFVAVDSESYTHDCLFKPRVPQRRWLDGVL